MLQVKDLSFMVEGKDSTLEIIDKVSFSLGNGRIMVVTGPNGGGKSTLAKLIMGYEKPTGGRILFNGEDITEKKRQRERLRHRLRVSAAAEI